MQPIQNIFAKVRLDRKHKRLEICWLYEPQLQEFDFVMKMVNRLMDKHQIQHLIQHHQ